MRWNQVNSVHGWQISFTLRAYAEPDCANAVAALRTANEIITRVMPLMIMLIPTRVPIAHAELDGHCR